MRTLSIGEDKIRESIVTDFEHNMFIEAGAGAGKTSIIRDRIVNQLKSGNIFAHELVVITFTNKAAAELYERIISKLRSEVTKCSEPEERKRLEVAINDIDSMTISTIHSFCKNIISERAFDARYPVDVHIAEENEDMEAKKAFFEKWFTDRASEIWKITDSYPEINKNKKGNKNWFKNSFKNKAEGLFCKLCSDVSDKNTEIIYNRELCKISPNYFNDKADSIRSRIRDKLLSLINEMDTDRTYNDISEISKYIVKSKNISSLNSDDNDKLFEYITNDAFYENIFSADNNKRNKDIIAVRTAVKEAYIDWYDSEISNETEKLSEMYEQYPHSIMTKYAEEAAKAYEAQKSHEYISNNDLLITARDLIVENKEVRKYFSEKYKCIYVDEFQDTDHIQEKMIFTLCLKENSENELRDGCLFVVGDPKQSIYRFRGAELRIYYELRDKMKNMDNARVYNLDKNFRSNSDIVQWVNTQFSTVIDGYSFMEACFSVPEGVISGVYKYDRPIFDTEDEKPKDEDVYDLCNVISGLTGSAQIYDKSCGVRNIMYKDFLVLTENTTHAEQYLKAFADNNIPVITGMKNEVSNDCAVSRFVMLYSYLSDRSRLNRAGAMEVALGTDFFDKEWHEEGMKRLYDIDMCTRGMNPYALAEYLLSQEDILLPHNAELKKSVVYSAMTRVRQFVETALSQHKGNRQELARMFREMREKDMEREIPFEPERDAVRFMNVHQSKGLEGNIVILADRASSFKFNNTAFRDGNKLYPSINTGGKNNYPAYKTDKDIENKVLKEEKDEYIRLQYVAATRAKQAIIIMDALCPNAGFSEYEPDLCASVIPLLNNNQNDEAFDEYTSPLIKAKLTQEQQKEQFITLNPSLLEKHEKYVPVTEVDNDIDENGKITDGDAEAEIKGAVFGTAMHRCFELFVNEWREKNFDTDTEKLSDKVINQAIMEGLDNIDEDKINDYIKILKKMLDGFMEDKELKDRIINAKAVYTELPFSYFINAEENRDMLRELGIEDKNEGRIWVNGTADLVIVNKDGTISIIDYKSNVDKTDLIERYKGQLTLYKYAVSKLFDTDISNISFEIKDYRD